MLQKSQNSKEKSLDAEIEEEIRLVWNKVYSDAYLNNYTVEQKVQALKNELGEAATLNKLTVDYRGKRVIVTEIGEIEIKKTMPEINAGEKTPYNSNAEYKSGNYIAIIPAGYTISNKQGESSIETGLVIKDDKENEFVWIPVNDNDFNKMFVTSNDEGWRMSGTNGENTVITRNKSNAATDVRNDLSRGNPGTTDFREPDVLNNNNFDKKASNLLDAGFGENKTISDLAAKLRDDYKDMMDSVKDNGGFYVGRYELGKDDNNNPQEKVGNVMNWINWYELYNACRFFSNQNVESRMIWGCQWDQLCRFIKNAKDANNNTINMDNSSSYGNYSGNTDNKTGTRSNCKTNNIFDLAGNYWEWTQEANDTSNRTIRGR